MEVRKQAARLGSDSNPAGIWRKKQDSSAEEAVTDVEYLTDKRRPLLIPIPQLRMLQLESGTEGHCEEPEEPEEPEETEASGKGKGKTKSCNANVGVGVNDASTMLPSIGTNDYNMGLSATNHTHRLKHAQYINSCSTREKAQGSVVRTARALKEWQVLHRDRKRETKNLTFSAAKLPKREQDKYMALLKNRIKNVKLFSEKYVLHLPATPREKVPLAYIQRSPMRSAERIHGIRGAKHPIRQRSVCTPHSKADAISMTCSQPQHEITQLYGLQDNCTNCVKDAASNSFTSNSGVGTKSPSHHEFKRQGELIAVLIKKKEHSSPIIAYKQAQEAKCKTTALASEALLKGVSVAKTADLLQRHKSQPRSPQEDSGSKQLKHSAMLERLRIYNSQIKFKPETTLSMVPPFANKKAFLHTRKSHPKLTALCYNMGTTMDKQQGQNNISQASFHRPPEPSSPSPTLIEAYSKYQFRISVHKKSHTQSRYTDPQDSPESRPDPTTVWFDFADPISYAVLMYNY